MPKNGKRKRMSLEAAREAFKVDEPPVASARGKSDFKRGRSYEKKRAYEAKERGAKERSDKRASKYNHTPNLPKRSGSLDSYGQVREDMRIGSIFPGYRDSRTRPLVTAFADDNYCVIRAARLDPLTQIAAYIGDANGIGNVVDASSSAERIKDWVAAQRTSFLESIFYAIEILHNLGMTAGLRQVLKLITEADGSWYWEQESWDSFLNGLSSRPVYVPVLAVNIVKQMNRMFKFQDPDGTKDVPATLWSPWLPDLTLANARTARDALYTRQAQALLHAEKAKLPMVQLTRALIESCFMIKSYVADNDDFAFMMNEPLLVDVGGTEEIMDELIVDAAGDNGKFTANMTTAYTTCVLLWTGERPSDLYALSRLMHPYSAVNNIMGMLQLDSVANDKAGAYYYAQNAVGGTAVPYPASAQYIPHFPFKASCAVHTGGVIGNTVSCLYLDDGLIAAPKTIGKNLLFAAIIGVDGWEKTGIDFASWREVETRYLSLLLTGQQSSHPGAW